jgi:integrase/recombinase XerD
VAGERVVITLREALPSYLRLRRGLGFKLVDAGSQLPRFVDFLEDHGADHITTALALSWAQQPASVRPAEWARRLGYVRGFARYRSAVDGRTEIPPARLLPHRSTRARPYIYSDVEVQLLLAAALQLPTSWHGTPLRPRVFHCLLGLICTTGMRMSEALDLQVADVDIDHAILTIRAAKFGRVRLIPLHASTVEVLLDYLRRRNECYGASSSYLFVSNRGNRLDQAQLHRTFYALSRSVGLRGATARHGPRLHDFRHRFALQVLTRWYEAGEDAARRLPVLSAYLGHVKVADTYWYLSAWPELMGHAMSRLEQRWGATS